MSQQTFYSLHPNLGTSHTEGRRGPSPALQHQIVTILRERGPLTFTGVLNATVAGRSAVHAALQRGVARGVFVAHGGDAPQTVPPSQESRDQDQPHAGAESGLVARAIASRTDLEIAWRASQ